MPSPEKHCYQVHEFAQLSGVTVRALHHYDREGLLKPAARSAAGYRLYTDRDLVRLEQIVVLKFLGLSLREIRQVRQQPAPRSVVPMLLSRTRHRKSAWCSCPSEAPGRACVRN